MSGSIKTPERQVMETQRTWLLCYYDGNRTKNCLIDQLPIEHTAELIQHLVDDMDYSVNVMIQIHSIQLDSNDVSAEGKILYDVDTDAFAFIRDLPCYRFVFKGGDMGEHLIDHTGQPARDF